MTNAELLKDLENWNEAVNENGYLGAEGNRVTINEAFMTADAPILFPRVVSRVLKEAAEPVQLITPLLDVVRLESGRSLEVPAINAIQAFEVPEGQEYPEQMLAFASQVEGKVTKKGLKIAFVEEVIADSQWDIVGLHIRAAARAMARLREQIAVSRFKTGAKVVFDSGNATTGVGLDGNPNGTLSFEDVIDMAAELMAEGKSATDFVLHPLMWSVFLKNSFVTGGGWSTNVGTPEGAVGETAPLGIGSLVSPFVDWTPKTGSDPAKSDIYLIDRNELGVNLIRDDIGIDEWDDTSRDIRNIKFRERYDVFIYGDENVTLAEDVTLARSYDVQPYKSV